MTTLFDSVNAPTGEPDVIVAGDFTQWKRTDLIDYDNTLFTLKYSLRLSAAAATEIEITAVADGATDYLVQIAAATTANYGDGTYTWQAYITRDADSERIALRRGSVVIRANLDADTTDPRSHNKIMLDKIESLLEGRADSDVENYSIGSRSITKMSVTDLVHWQSVYASRYQTELDAVAIENGAAAKNSIRVRFV